MGFFDLFKKKKVVEPSINNTEKAIPANQVLLAMPLFKNKESYDIQKVLNHLKSYWGLKLDDTADGDDETMVFKINGQMVAIAKMPAPVPLKEIEEIAPYNYYWKTAVDDLKDHTGHAIVSVLSGDQSPVDRYILLSKMLCSILTTSNCVGIYQGATTQLFPKEYYLAFTEELKNNEVIPPLWIYFGIRNDDNGVSLYTYGLENFGKLEMEILNSKQDGGDMYEFMVNIINYVLTNNVTFYDGETIGYTAEQKVPLTISKGIYVDGQTIKMGI